MVQTIRPASDIDLGNWTAEPSSPATGFDKLDETSPSDADYIESPANPVDEEFEVKFTAAQDPLRSDGYVVSYRYGKNASGGQNIDATFYLIEGSTVIASWSHTNVAAGFTTAAQTLTTPQADSITDHANLRLRGRANAP